MPTVFTPEENIMETFDYVILGAGLGGQPPPVSFI
jgi:hypothetical protein